MKKIILFTVFIFLSWYQGLSSAQMPDQERDRNYFSVNERKCKSLNCMDLSEDQQKAIESIRISYRKTILQLRSNLMIKQIELGGLLRDPAASEKKIRAKACEIEKLDNQFERVVLDYQLSIREALTPEQIRMWCTSGEMPDKR